MCAVHKVSAVLVIVGAINWGLVGIAKFNLVTTLLGSWPTVERVVYVLVGLAGLAMLGVCKCCMSCGKCEKCGMGDVKPPMMGGQQM